MVRTRAGIRLNFTIRPERPGDEPVISALITKAFATADHSSGTEAAIVDGLRDDDALTLSLVAEAEEVIVGHIAFSPITIDGQDQGWFGLGPVAVAPDRQRHGIGDALVRQGLAQLRASGANGCVVLGDPAYYARFGFTADPRLTPADIPPEYFQALHFGGDASTGMVHYHAAFAA